MLSKRRSSPPPSADAGAALPRERRRPRSQLERLAHVGVLALGWLIPALLGGCGGGGSAPVTLGAAPTSTPTPTPTPTPSPTPTPTPTPLAWEQPLSATSLPSVQMNPAADLNRAWMFADMLRGTELWIIPKYGTPPLTSAQADALASGVGVDPQGWPTALPAGYQLEMIVGYNTTSTRYLHGVFVLTWEGTGTVDLQSSVNNGLGCQTLLSTSNRRVLRMDDDAKCEVVFVTSSDPTDPVRNMRLWAPRYDGAGLDLTPASDLAPGHIVGSLEPQPGDAGPLFHPQYIAHLQQAPDAGCMRFLGWLNINGINSSTPLTWADRGDPDRGVGSLSVIDTQWERHGVPGFKNQLGYPYEWLIELCNLTGKDLWIQVPHTATADLHTHLAQLVHSTLRSDLRCWVEYSNEIWNSASPYLPQRTQAADAAAAHFNVPAASLSFDQLGWGSGQLQGTFLKAFEDAWKQAGGSDARLVNVAAGFALGGSFNKAVVDSIREVDPNLAEVLCVSSYFGDSVQGEIYDGFAFGSAPGAWPLSLFDSTARTVRRNLYECYAAWKQEADRAQSLGLPLVAYEGGQTMLALGFGDASNPGHTDFMSYLMAFQRSPQMAELYKEHFALFNAAGARMPSLFMDVGTWSFWGYWGAKELITQTRADSGKWDAFLWWGETQRGVRAPHDPKGSAPQLAVSLLEGEAGQAFSQDIAATGGDGAVTVSLLAGSLPPGISLQAASSGHATLSGTPTTPGSYKAVLRARDADGDVDDQPYTIVVDPVGLSTNALMVFEGAKLPASPPGPSNTGAGRYDPVRATQTLDGGARLCVPFDLSQPLFANEFLASNQLPPTSPLTMYGGWSVHADAGHTPNLNSWTGLREGQFQAWVGDLAGSFGLDAVLLWRADQFNAMGGSGRYGFGATVDRATLQADLTHVVSDGSNELRFVVVDRRSGVDTWFLSEAAWTHPYIGDGIFSLQGFSGNSTPGYRWAQITPPSSTTIAMPTSGLSYGAETFSDVQEVGLFYHGTRWQWNFNFGFSRFFALGKRQ